MWSTSHHTTTNNTNNTTNNNNNNNNNVSLLLTVAGAPCSPRWRASRSRCQGATRRLVAAVLKAAAAATAKVIG